MAVPHFAYPFRVSGDHVAVVEQDTWDEVAQSVQMVLTTERGSRLAVPEYGVDSPLFATLTRGREQHMLEAVNRWEPRARATIGITADNVDEFVHHIRVEIPTRHEDNTNALPQSSSDEEPIELPGFGVGGFGEGGFGE